MISAPGVRFKRGESHAKDATPAFFSRPYRTGFVTHVVVQALMNFQN
jgi:hypothetical protein